MPKCIVVADDLTGANATGVLLKKSGFDTFTLLRGAMDRASTLSACDCLVVPTDSRAVSPGEAYDRVRETLLHLRKPDVRLYAKRIDSTLRGNLGSETDAFLDVLGEAYMAVCVPCFPSSGRALVGGYLLVNHVPLRQTEAAQDPKCPVHLSDAQMIFRMQTRYPVAALHLDDVAQGAESLIALTGMVQGYRESSKVFPNGVKILLVSPIRIDPVAANDPFAPLRGCDAQSARFAEFYRHTAQENGVFFFDAASVASPSKIDGVHMDPQAHRALGLALADAVRKILG